ncbi:ras association (RalGDS/AF-6) domain-containing protein [Paraphysoderma sedebokerense]|nr:ras association (RalGDS/AF-6) domain-containing protein [Paraphysoderma sedebokerense]
MLKELDVSSLGHRIAMLKSIYQLKKQYGVPLEPGDYVPETVELETQYQQKIDKKRNDGRDEEVGKLQSILKERDQQIQRLGKDVEKISKEMSKLKDELEPIFKMSREFKHILEKEKKHSEVSKKHKHSSSSRKSTKSSPEYSRSMNTPRSPLSVPDSGGAIRVYGDRLQNREGESYKSFRISLEDPCSKVLPAALKKYKINDDWQQYALFIVYRNSERCLGYDESPLSVYNQLKEAGEDPVFVLKHIKQVKNPASRTSDQSVVSSVHSGSLLGLNSSKNDISASSSSLNNTNSGQLTKSNEGNLNGSDAILNSDEGTAVVIYEYAAQREDELDISIGDKLNIKQRSTGWYVVEKNGQVGWVPMGCLLEDTDTDQFKVGDGKGPARGYALYDYAKIGPNELSIRKGDVLMVHKKYQHWLLADCNSRTGWVPSCYVSMEIGKSDQNISDESSLY